MNDTTRKSMLAIQATPDIAGIRTAQLNEVEHTVVPCVALVEGVLWPANAGEPELALAEEFGRFPEGWNGRPVVMNHPKVNQVPVSASHPEVLEDWAFGQMFNTHLDGDKLKTEIWINTARVESLGGEVQETVERLLSGEEVVEVSTGLFTMNEESSGSFNGQKYGAIWRNIVPDHLAVLSEGTIGACSVEGGCGAPRTNKLKPVMQAVRLDIGTDCTCGGECEECKQDLIANATDDSQSDKKPLWESLKQAMMKIAGMSDVDLRGAIRAALVAGSDEPRWVVAVFQNTERKGKVVFEQGFEGKLFEVSYSVSSKGGVSIKDDATEVRPETQFVPVTVNAGVTVEENTMTIEERVAALITNEATRFKPEDTEWLSTLSEEQLAQMEPVEAPVAEPESTESVSAAAEEESLDDAQSEVVDRSPVSLESYLEGAPQEIGNVLREGIKLQEERKSTLIAGIKANGRNKFTDEQLDSFDTDTLQNLASLADAPDYSGSSVGNASIRDNAEGDDEESNITPAPDFMTAIAADQK